MTVLAVVPVLVGGVWTVGPVLVGGVWAVGPVLVAGVCAVVVPLLEGRFCPLIPALLGGRCWVVAILLQRGLFYERVTGVLFVLVARGQLWVPLYMPVTLGEQWPTFQRHITKALRGFV